MRTIFSNLHLLYLVFALCFAGHLMAQETQTSTTTQNDTSQAAAGSQSSEEEEDEFVRNVPLSELMGFPGLLKMDPSKEELVNILRKDNIS